MKAVVIESHRGSVTVQDVLKPIPARGQVLVQMHYCGVCHTDIHAIDGDWHVKSKLPLTPGHEGVGTIAQLGEDAPSNLSVGDRVGIPWLGSSCHWCEFCLSGYETLCEQQECTGFTIDGCMSEFALANAEHVVKIPPQLTLEQAAPLLCAGVTTFKGIKETDVSPGQFLVITGAAGGLGHLAIQYAVAMGLRVVAIDVGAEKVEYCKSIGAEFAVDASAVDVVQQVLQITSGGAHGVLCLAPQPRAFEMSFHVTRRKGTLVCIALPTGSFPIPILDLVLKRVTIRGSIVGTRKDMHECLEFAARGKVHSDIEIVPMRDIADVLKRLRAGQVQGRIVLQIGSAEAAISADELQQREQAI